MGRTIGQIITLSAPLSIARFGELLLVTSCFSAIGRNAPADLPALAVAWATFSVFAVACHGFLHFINILMTRSCTSGDTARSGRLLTLGIGFAILCGCAYVLTTVLLYFLFEVIDARPDLIRHLNAIAFCAAAMPAFLLYLTLSNVFAALQMTILDVAGTVVANVTNFVLLWHFAPQMSLETVVICFSVSLLMGVFASLAIAYTLFPERMPPPRLPVGLIVLREAVATGLPIGFLSGLDTGLHLIFFAFALWIGAQDAAVFQTSNSLLNCIYIVNFGVGIAVGIKICTHPRHEHQAIFDVVLSGLTVALIPTLLVGTLLLSVPGIFSAIMSTKLAYREAMDDIFRIGAGLVFLECVALVLRATLRSLGDMRFLIQWSFVIDWLLGLFLTALLVLFFGLGVKGIYWALFLSQMMSVAVMGGRTLVLLRPLSAP